MTSETVAAPASDGVVARARALVPRIAGGAVRGPVLGYAIFTVVVFLVALAASFPHDLLVQRALRSATASGPIRIEAGPGSLGWTLAYGLESLRVRSAESETGSLLELTALELVPSRLGLLAGRPYPVGIAAGLYGGALRGVVDPRPARFAVDAALADVDLGRYAATQTWVEGGVRGRLHGTLALDGGGRGPAAATGTLRLRIDGLVLDATKIRGVTVPDLRFTDVHLDGTVKNGRLEIEELIGEADKIRLQGSGNVLLRDPVPASVVNLELVVTPTSGADDGLRTLIGFLPGSKADGGGRRMTVVGTLGRPTVR